VTKRKGVLTCRANCPATCSALLLCYFFTLQPTIQHRSTLPSPAICSAVRGDASTGSDPGTGPSSSKGGGSSWGAGVPDAWGVAGEGGGSAPPGGAKEACHGPASTLSNTSVLSWPSVDSPCGSQHVEGGQRGAGEGQQRLQGQQLKRVGSAAGRAEFSFAALGERPIKGKGLLSTFLVKVGASHILHLMCLLVQGGAHEASADVELMPLVLGVGNLGSTHVSTCLLAHAQEGDWHEALEQYTKQQAWVPTPESIVAHRAGFAEGFRAGTATSRSDRWVKHCPCPTLTQHSE